MKRFAVVDEVKLPTFFDALIRSTSSSGILVDGNLTQQLTVHIAR
jgi:hypothetical protein